MTHTAALPPAGLPRSPQGDAVDIAALEQDPYRVYADLRRRAPVTWVPAARAVFVTRWDDVSRVVRDRDVFSAHVRNSPLTLTLGPNLLHSDGPWHAARRAPLAQALRPETVINRWQEMIDARLADLIDALPTRGTVDLIAELAEPLAMQVLCDVTGLPALSSDVFRRWLDGIGAGASNYEGDPAKASFAAAVNAEIDAYLDDIIRTGPRIGTLLAALVGDRDSFDPDALQDVRSAVKLLIIGGMQEPRDLFGIAMNAVLTDDAVRSDVATGGAPAVLRLVEESLRWGSPVGTATRETTRDVDIAGTLVPAGTTIAAVLASANRDERRWQQPDRFDPGRGDIQHLAFAAGAHTCVGAALARAQARTAVQAMLRRYPDIAGDGNATFHGWEFRGPALLPVELAGDRHRPPARTGGWREMTVTTTRLVAKDAAELTLQPVGDEPLPPWAPGAHVHVQTAGVVRRRYSLCGDPAADTWTIVVRRVPGGAGSGQLHALQPGNRLRVRGPQNDFALAPAPRYLFVAGGIGVTPLLPMARQVAAAGTPWSMVYLGRDRSSMPLVDDLEHFGAGRVRVIETAKAGRPAVADIVDSLEPSTAIYACGPDQLLADLDHAVARHPTINLHVERFAPPPHQTPIGAVERPFTATLARTNIDVPVPAGTSLVDALASAGTIVPTSCREGSCGSCETRVLRGSVDHRGTFLSDDDQRRGDVMLPCVSGALSESLVLDL